MLAAAAALPVQILAFTTNTLRLQEGVVPTTNGIPVAGASAYSGTVDTHIMLDFPTNSYGDQPILRFHKHNYSSNTIHAFIRFENFQNYLPEKAAVVGARLYLTSAGDGDTASEGNEFGFVNSPWDESLTWNTRGSTVSGRTPIGSWLRPGGSEWTSGTVSYVCLTAMVQAWRSNQKPNYGITLCAKEGFMSTYREHRCHSSESPEIEKRPYLEIDYVVPELFCESNKYYLRSVIITNGPAVLEDTFIRSNNVNYAAADKVSWLGTWNYTPDPPERILLRIDMNNPALSELARTGQRIAGKPILVSAQLQLNAELNDRCSYVNLWKCNQPWIAAQATGGYGLGTRDGTNSWAAPWSFQISNVDGPVVSQAWFPSPMYAGTLHFDITGPIQQYADGSNNFGFVIGETGYDGTYGLRVVLSEYAAEFMRPTLVLETKIPQMRGTVVLVK